MKTKRFQGKHYDNNVLSLISSLLYNIRWIGVFLLIYCAVVILEDSTDSTGLSTGGMEYLFWTCVLALATFLLFKFKAKWEGICDKITDYIANSGKGNGEDTTV